jgi:hypothetical protein
VEIGRVWLLQRVARSDAVNERGHNDWPNPKQPTVIAQGNSLAQVAAAKEMTVREDWKIS